MQGIKIVHLLPEYTTKFVVGLLSSVSTDTQKILYLGFFLIIAMDSDRKSFFSSFKM